MKLTPYGLAVVFIATFPGTIFGQAANSAFERFMNRTGASIQKGIESITADTTSESSLADISGKELSERIDRIAAIQKTEPSSPDISDGQQASTSAQMGTGLQPIPLPVLPSYVTNPIPVDYEGGSTIRPAVGEENSRIKEYYSSAYPTLPQPFLGLNLGASFSRVIEKCEAKSLMVTVEDSFADGDDLGVPNRYVTFNGSLADVEVCDKTTLVFMMDRLVRINCYQLQPGIVENIRQKYGLNPDDYGKIMTNVDGQAVSVSLDEQLGLTYTYEGLKELGDRYEKALEEAIKSAEQLKQQNEINRLDL